MLRSADKRDAVRWIIMTLANQNMRFLQNAKVTRNIYNRSDWL